jgi:peptide/nickel transport system permease protein
VQAYVVRRLLIGLLIIWGVYTLTFFAVNLAPGDPFANLENPKMKKEDIERLRAKWGYDRPVLERYLLQLRKTFWADREVLALERGGLALEVFALGEGNGVTARVQVPEARLLLEPDEETRRERGASTVVLERDGDAWPAREAVSGVYYLATAKITVGAARDEVYTQGVRLVAEGGRLSAEVALAAPPDEVLLEPVASGAAGEAERPVVRLEAAGDGRYAAREALPGRYRVRIGDRLDAEDVLVPPERLEPGGLTFDLGTSVMEKEPVVSYLAAPLVNTLILATASLFFYYLVGILLGVLSATRPNSKTDHALTIGSLFVYSMPGFWLALMLVLLFSVKLDWLPSQGMHDVGEGGLFDLLEHMILPVFVLGIAGAAATARYQRSALLEVLGQDYIRTARAKGLDERTVIWKHAMRNSLLPVITLFGLSFPFLVSGAVITEKIFSWPGMGSAVIKAVSGRDVMVLTGVTLLATTMVVVGNLIADILYALADPRVRLK